MEQRRCLPDLFEARVRSSPAGTALVYLGTRSSYAQLNASANRLAHALIGRGIGADTVVALGLPRCPEMVIALLAVLKTGAASLPVDPGYPSTRRRLMLQDAGAALLVTTAHAEESFSASGVPRLVLDDPAVAARVAAAPGTDPTDADRNKQLTSADTAYVIYTSGSTGPPKGVAVAHRSVVNLFDSHCLGLFASAVTRAGGRQVLRAAQTASFSFDASWHQLLWMFAGHELHILDDATRSDPDEFVDYVARHHIDYVGPTPSYLQFLVSAGLLEGQWCPGTITVGGEAIPEDLWSRLRSTSGVDAFNLYGTTECTVDSLVANLADTPRPSLGRPILNTRIYVLDEALEPVAKGAVGELYVSGSGLAKGYLGNPELTAERFVECPFEQPGDRMYRTGDLVRSNSTGDLEFVGRSDGQIKIRGFRIEPGEIEAHLRTHPAVAHAAVIARPGIVYAAQSEQSEQSEGMRLVAYVIPAASESGSGADGRVAVSVDALRSFAREHLPEHMVPSVFVSITDFPLTAHGKLDHAALPDPPAPSTTSRTPRTPTERALCPLFAQVLGLESVGIDDDLFDLGGHSLLAIKLAKLIGVTLDTTVSVRSVLEAPTVAGLGELIDAGIDLDPFETVLALRAGGPRPALFCLPPAGGIGWFYAGFVPYLDADQPVYALQALALGRAHPDVSAGLSDFEQMTADYVAHIRAVQPNGPYHLLGWSFGGTLAHAVAVALREQGEPVAFLAILDARPLRPGQDVEPLDPDLVRTLLTGFADAPETQSVDSPGGDDRGASHSGRTVGGILRDLEVAGREKVVTIATHDSTLLPSSPPKEFDGALLFFQPTLDSWAGSDPEDVWRSLIAGPITVHQIECGHAEMAQPAAAAQIGRTLTERLCALGETTHA